MPNHVCDMSHVRWPRHTAVWHRWHSAAWHMWYSVAWHMWHSGVCDVFIFVSQISCAWVMSNMHVCDMPHVRWPRHQRRVTPGAFMCVCCVICVCVVCHSHMGQESVIRVYSVRCMYGTCQTMYVACHTSGGHGTLRCDARHTEVCAMCLYVCHKSGMRV